MIKIEQRGKNIATINKELWSDGAHRFSIIGKNTLYAPAFKDVSTARYLAQYPAKPNTTYTISFDINTYLISQGFVVYSNLTYDTANNKIINKGTKLYAQYNLSTNHYVFNFTTPNDCKTITIWFDTWIGSWGTSSTTPTYITNLQLEEGSVATPYEDPWVNTLNFDDNLHAGEFLQKSKGIFYIHKTWYRDEQNNPYEQLTFTNGVATPSAITSEPVIVEDISTGEIKNAMVSGSAVNVYLNQYDSWDVTNSTTTAFTLSKTALKPDFPVAINGTVTTSGFTTSTTQIVFDNAVASGSSVSCVYPYLDTGYNSDAKVFYQTAPKDEAISANEQKQFTLLAKDDTQISTASTTLSTVKSIRINTTNTNIEYIRPTISLWSANSSATATVGINIDGGANYTQSTSSTDEQIVSLGKIKIRPGMHTINIVASTTDASYQAYTKYLEIYGE